MKFTERHWRLALSSKGGISSAQWRALGITGAPRGGKARLKQMNFTQKQLDEFIVLKDAHLKKKRVKRKSRQFYSDEQKKAEKALKVYEENEELRKRIRELGGSPPPSSHLFDKNGSTRWQYGKPQWLNLRDKILRRDNWTCRLCGERTKTDGLMVVHHLLYEKGMKVWEVPDCYLVSLCKRCHKAEHSRHLIPPPKHF